MADRGFTALKFDLDLPLLPGEDLYARTISPAQMDRQVALAEATVAAVAGRADVAFDLHWRYAPADALRLARSLEHLPVLWLEDPTPPQDLASVARIAERTTTPICTGENLYGLDGFVALMAARRCRHPRSGHPEGRRALRHEADRGARRRSLEAAGAAQHRRADRHARLRARLCVDPELPRPRVARGVGAVLRRARHARPAGHRGRLRHAARRPGNRRGARPRGGSTLRASRCAVLRRALGLRLTRRESPSHARSAGR